MGAASAAAVGIAGFGAAFAASSLGAGAIGSQLIGGAAGAIVGGTIGGIVDCTPWVTFGGKTSKRKKTKPNRQPKPHSRIKIHARTVLKPWIRRVMQMDPPYGGLDHCIDLKSGVVG